MYNKVRATVAFTLLFIGFNRLWHFTYIRLDAIICGFFNLTRLPAASTFWRYVDSLGINQAHSYFKMMAEISNQSAASDTAHSAHDSLKGLKDNLIRIARLKLLLIGAKVVYHSRDRVKYSMMDSRTPGLMHFLNYLDRARARARPWLSDNLWPCRFSLNSI